MRFPSHSTALRADMFHRTPMKRETCMTPAAYMQLLKAAREKNKMAEFYTWQRNRKITLKG